MLSAVTIFAADILLFIVLPYLIWRLCRRTIPLVVLPILIGLLLAASGLAAQYHTESSVLSTQIGFIGVLLLAFSAGLEMHLSPAGQQEADPPKRNVPQLLFSALNALFIPFIAGVTAAYLYFNQLPGWDTASHGKLFSALAIGLCLAVSALPVLIGIVRELPAGQRYLGTLALKLAVIDDVVLWCGLALLLLLAGVSESASWGSAELLAVIALAALPLTNTLLKKHAIALPGLASWLLAAVYLLIASWATYSVGLHAILGAYYAGAIFPKHLLRHLPAEKLGTCSLFLLSPLFFGYSGLKISPEALNMTAIYAALLLLVLSVVTKVGAVLVCKPESGLTRHETLSVGVLLQCKGLMEIVAATILYQHGLLSEYAYAALVTLAVLSTALTGPWFRWLNRTKTCRAAASSKTV